MDLPEFKPFASIPRLFRQCVITEKLDGTNAQVWISDDLQTVAAGSRNRWITPEDDNYGFARWVHDHVEELRTLGPGHHYGEWWGAGIQRRYGLTEKRWSLFNVHRWCLAGTEPAVISGQKMQDVLPACVGLVPVLARGTYSDVMVEHHLSQLKTLGSVAAPGFMDPEGIVVFHQASNQLHKVTLGGDGHKGAKGLI